MNATAAERDYISIGQLAAHVQRSVREIERTADRLGIVPAMRLNMIPHFDAAQVEALTATLREVNHDCTS